MIIGYHRRSVSPYFPNRLATSTSCDDEDDDEGGKYEVKESERTNAQLIEIKASFLS